MTKRNLRILLAATLLCGVFAQLSTAQPVHRVALIEPEVGSAPGIEGFVDALNTTLSSSVRTLDRSQTLAAFRSVAITDPFNMSTSEGRSVGAVTGSSHFVVLRSAIQRRASLEKQFYFEAFAVVFVVDSRSGSLVDFILESQEAATPQSAAELLLEKAETVATRIATSIRKFKLSPRDARFPEVPEQGLPGAKGLQTPVPYRRIRPEYTSSAYLYGVKGTVDIEVDIEANGTIAATRIERWLGFGLEASVEKAVREMQWRGAERDGRFLAMRVLLRYNFTKIEKDDAN